MAGETSSGWMDRLQQAKNIPDFFERQLYVAAVISAVMAEQGIRIILVGGTAVEFYTFGGYATRDLDMVCVRREEAKAVLAELGFQRDPGVRHWYHPDLNTALEIPDERLAGSETRTVTIEIKGLPLTLIGIEDLILDRVRAYVHWRSDADGEWAVRLMALHIDEIDWEYLDQQARSEELLQPLHSLQARAKQLVSGH